MTSGPWEPVLDVTTTRDELEVVIARETATALDDLRVQIDGMEFGPRDRETAMALISPAIEARTRAALLGGWQALQREAGRADDDIIH